MTHNEITSIMKNVTDEELIRVSNELLEFKKTGELVENSLCKKYYKLFIESAHTNTPAVLIQIIFEEEMARRYIALISNKSN